MFLNKSLIIYLYFLKIPKKYYTNSFIDQKSCQELFEVVFENSEGGITQKSQSAWSMAHRVGNKKIRFFVPGRRRNNH